MGTGNSPVLSVARIRGRTTGTRRPARGTEPGSWPCRVAVRSRPCRPWLTEGAGAALDAMGDRFRGRAVSGASDAVQAAADQCGLSYVEFDRGPDPGRGDCPAPATALNAAAETAMQKKLQLMGRVLANAATDTG